MTGLHAALAALLETWVSDEEGGIEHVATCQDHRCRECVVIACATDLRGVLAECPADLPVATDSTIRYADAVEQHLGDEWHADQCGCDEWPGACVANRQSLERGRGPYNPPSSWSIHAVLEALDAVIAAQTKPPVAATPVDPKACRCVMTWPRGIHEPVEWHQAGCQVHPLPVTADSAMADGEPAEVERARERVRRRAELRREAAERGRELPEAFRENLRQQFAESEEKARRIVADHTAGACTPAPEPSDRVGLSESIAAALAEHDDPPGWTSDDNDMPVYECNCGDQSPALDHDYIRPSDAEDAAAWHRGHVASHIERILADRLAVAEQMPEPDHVVVHNVVVTQKSPRQVHVHRWAWAMTVDNQTVQRCYDCGAVR
ncbi:hypothetical protein [Pimelobacter simplex]|uniref:hypothetical protein n=1 Tax=Nocardioides simplex TaxID=2045 RepID=UPI003AB08466